MQKLTAKLKGLYIRYKEIVDYVIFGGLTTLVNWAVFFPLFNFCNVEKLTANTIAWIISVIFAYVTNKIFVFHSERKDAGFVAVEFLKFAGGRLFSLGVETLSLWLLSDILSVNTNISKIVVAVIVVILNYVLSKLFIFAGKDKKK